MINKIETGDKINCFGAETDQEMEKRDMWVPHKELKKKQKKMKSNKEADGVDNEN